MYRLILYCLLFLAFIAFALSLLQIITLSPPQLLMSLGVLLIISHITNKAYGSLFHAPLNIESSAITALILFFIMPPPTSTTEIVYIASTAFLANSLKFIVARHQKHIFNPAALSALLMGIVANYPPSWWVGTPDLFPFVAVLGFLVVRKIRRIQMFLAFVAVSLSVLLTSAIVSGQDLTQTLLLVFTSGPLLFFASIMLTEPLTTPPTQKLRLVYASIVGVLFSFPMSIGPIYPTPELALLVGNAFSYLSGYKKRHTLTLKDKIQETHNVLTFVFQPDIRPNYKAGQYIELTFPHKKADSRGNRRFFTLSSSPTEDTVQLGMKFYTPPSTLKKTFVDLKKGDKVVVGQLAGDFTLPDDPSQKMIWIAGGIGVTPFRSMAKYLLDTSQKRDIVFFHTAKTKDDFPYQNLFEEVSLKIGLKPNYVIAEKDTSTDWTGYTGHLTEEIIKKEVSDYKERVFYISGSTAMVDACKDILNNLGIPKTNVVTDYFPGYA